MDQMIIEIKQALSKVGVTLWSMEKRHNATAELFFIRRRMDMRRMTDTTKYHVTVFRDFTQDGKEMRGTSSVCIVPSQTREEIESAISDAYFAASFVSNPTYTLPEAAVCQPMVMPSTLTEISVEQAAMQMAEALFAADNHESAVVNSAEIFTKQTRTHLLTSWGTDVDYTKYNVNGEFVAQCKEPVDVEMYHSFSYDDLDTDALTKTTADALNRVVDRANAKACLPSGSYDVILSENHIATILSYFASKSNAGMIFPGYSDWTVGKDVQGEHVTGEKLNLTLRATVPYSAEGIPMVDRPLIENGTLSLIHGSARLCSYMGIAPTGEYRAVVCDNGTTSLEDMKKSPYLYPVAFSDFQMDSMSGHFGGEIRLAYWFDGETTRLVTGGSINGSIFDCGGQLTFSTERYRGARYQGPLAVKMPGIPVAGTV